MRDLNPQETGLFQWQYLWKYMLFFSLFLLLHIKKEGNNIDLELKTHLLGGRSHLQSSALPLTEIKIFICYIFLYFTYPPAVNQNIPVRRGKRITFMLLFSCFNKIEVYQEGMGRESIRETYCHAPQVSC